MLDYPDVLDRTFHALADPSRRGMLDRLSRGPASVSELAAPLSMTLAAVVQHVQVLESTGLIHTEKVGRTRTCSMRPDALHNAEQWLTQRRSEWERQLDRLGLVLDETANRPPPSPSLR